MRTSRLEQDLRNLIARHHARWSGRAPSTEELAASAGRVARADVEDALTRLEREGLVHRVGGGWHARALPPQPRAVASLADRMRLYADE